MQRQSLIAHGISRLQLFSVAIIAIIARIAAVLFLENTASWSWTKADLLMEYGIFAKNMISGYGYSYTWKDLAGNPHIVTTAYMPPGQSYIDYACFKVFGVTELGVMAIFAINVIVSVISIFLIAKIAQKLFGNKRITTITLWGLALYPGFLYSTATFGVTTIVILIQACIMLLAIRFIELYKQGQRVVKESILIGLGFGVMCLFRGEAPIYIIVTLLFLLYSCRNEWKAVLPSLLLSAVISVCILAPWTIRNYIVLDRFVPISSNGGFNFWRGNNAFTTGSPWTETGGPLWSTDELWGKIQVYFDSGVVFDRMQSEIHIEDAKQWIAAHPTEAMILWAKKALIFWTFDTKSKMGGTIAYMGMYAITLILFCIGLFSLYRKNNLQFGIKLILLWCVIATGVSMVFFPLPRLQIIVIASYFPIVAFGASNIFERLKPTTNF